MLRRIIVGLTLLGAVCGVGLARATAPAAAAGTLVVTNASGDQNVAGSLPWAVNRANYNGNGLDSIRFAIPGTGVHEIALRGTLYLREPLIIDGTTQAGYRGTPTVRLVGSRGISSLVLAGVSNGNTIRGLGFYGYGANAVTLLAASNNNVIRDNWIGFTVRGTAILRNSAVSGFSAGIGIQSSGNLVQNNAIAGVYNGIVVGEPVERAWSGRWYTNNSFRYNKIGTEPFGTATAWFGNASDGIFFGAGAATSWVGPGNVIAGQRSSGVELLHSSNTGIAVFQNFIGTDRTATKALGNNELGVQIARGAHGNSVWGNYLAANRLGAVSLESGANGNWVNNNIIGLAAGQRRAIGGQAIGINVSGHANSNVVQSNAVGGHPQHGVIIADSAGNRVQYNWIGRGASGAMVGNGGFGVYLLRASGNGGLGNSWGLNLLGNVGGSGGNAIR